MNRTSRNTVRMGLILGVLATAACSNQAQQTVSDSNAYLAETAIGSINAGLTNDERSNSVAGGAGDAASAKMAVSRSLATASCGSSRYAPALGGSSCSGTVSNETVTSTLNCSVAQGLDVLLKGSATLTFDSPATCGTWLNSVPTSGSVTWTSGNFQRITTDGSGITTSSASVKNYKGVAIGGGIKSVWSETTGATVATDVSLNINGLHVVRLATGNVQVFDHTITTTGALAVSGTLAAGTRTITSGVVVIDHNVADFTATGTIANLKWGQANCCLPTSGTISFAMSGSGQGNILINFDTGTCGKISVADASVLATATSPSPTPVPSGMAVNYQTTIGGCQ